MHTFPEYITETLLRSDLKAEIERTKSLAGRASSKPPTDINHQAAVILLYEDLTNILITGVKSERDPQLPGGSTNYQCVYTQRSDTAARSEHSSRKNDVPGMIQQLFIGIRFQLQMWRESDGKGRETEHVRYTPLDLDKESAQFREKLKFIGTSFAFEKHQIQVFFEQLKEHVGEAAGVEADVIEVLSDG